MEYAEISDSALDFLKNHFKRDIQPADHLEKDLNLDSLDRAEILLALQEHLNLEFSDNAAVDFFSSDTIEELLSNLKKHLTAGQLTDQPSMASYSWSDAFHQEISDEHQMSVKLHFGVFSRAFNILTMVILKVFFKIFYRLEVKGRDLLPKSGPLLICPNHTSFFDGVLIISALSFSQGMRTYFVGYRMFFDKLLIRPFQRIYRLIPLEITENLIDVLKTCGFILQKEKTVCYFPEGERSWDGEIKDFKKGVAILIKELNIPVVPTYIKGAYDAWPRGQKLPKFAKISVQFGHPLKYEQLCSDPAAADVYSEVTKNLHQKVLDLHLWSK